MAFIDRNNRLRRGHFVQLCKLNRHEKNDHHFSTADYLPHVKIREIATEDT